MLPLEPRQIEIQPGTGVIDARVNQYIEVRSKFCKILRVGYELSLRARGPGTRQGNDLLLYLGRWDWFVVGWYYGKSRPSIKALHDNVGIEILRTGSETSSQLKLIHYGTSKGGCAGSIPENPVASAVGRRAESDLERCSAMVSVERVNSSKEKKDAVTNEKLPPSYSPAGR